MRYIAIATAALVAAVVVFGLATLPSAPLRIEAPRDAAASRTMRGAFHVHSTVSDGRGDRLTIASAARRAGLQFVVFTDHGDGTAAPAPPSYIDGVLCVDGVEISTNDGHYIALGIGASPYRLGGDAAAVVEDVRRLGGFGVVAHPDSIKQELAWHDWSAATDGLEWLNGDSEWRNESRRELAASLLHYFVRPAATLAELLDPPGGSLRAWQQLIAQRPVVALAGHDAHGGLGGFAEQGRASAGLPSYEALFGAFSTRAVLDAAPTGDAVRDASELIAALRLGHAYTVIDGQGGPGGLDYQASFSGGVARMGDSVDLPEPIAFEVRLPGPKDARLALMRNGREVATSQGQLLQASSQGAGAYYVEVRLPQHSARAPWILTNPIYVDLPSQPAAEPEAAQREVATLTSSPWRIEKDPASEASLSTGPSMTYRLRDGAEDSQFVALVTPIESESSFDAVSLDLAADRPIRVSAQLRTADGAGRWRRSVFVPVEGTQVVLPLHRFLPADISAPRTIDAKSIRSFLLVIDLVNSRPGAAGRLTVRSASLSARR